MHSFALDAYASGGEWIAEGSFSDSIHHASNFGQLRIRTLPSSVDDQTQMRAAGFLEGVLTAGKCERVDHKKVWGCMLDHKEVSEGEAGHAYSTLLDRLVPLL